MSSIINRAQKIAITIAILALITPNAFANPSDDYEDELISGTPQLQQAAPGYRMLGTIGFLHSDCAGELHQAIADAEARDDDDAAAAQLAGFDPSAATSTETALHTAYSKVLNQGTNLVAMVYTFDQAAAPAATTVASAASNPGRLLQCGRNVSLVNIADGIRSGNIAQTTSGAVNSVAILVGVSNAVASVGSGLSFAQSGKTFQVPQWIDDAAAAAFSRFTPQTAGAAVLDASEVLALPVVTMAPRSAIAPITHVAYGSSAPDPRRGTEPRPGWAPGTYRPFGAPGYFTADFGRTFWGDAMIAISTVGAIPGVSIGVGGTIYGIGYTLGIVDSKPTNGVDPFSTDHNKKQLKDALEKSSITRGVGNQIGD